MSWRLLTKQLRDGPKTIAQLSDLIDAIPSQIDDWARGGLNSGAICRVGIGRYAITPMGLAMLENRVEFRRITGRLIGSEMAWHATWMQPLPRYAEDVLA